MNTSQSYRWQSLHDHQGTSSLVGDKELVGLGVLLVPLHRSHHCQLDLPRAEMSTPRYANGRVFGCLARFSQRLLDGAHAGGGCTNIDTVTSLCLTYA